MNVISAMDDPVLFAPDIHPGTNRPSRTAVALRSRSRAQAEGVLWEARGRPRLSPGLSRPIPEFYANAKRLTDAERVVRLAPAETARQCGFPVSWRRLAESLGHFYSFSLKTLAFPTLRQGRTDEASSILDDLRRLDPEDRVGGSVIRTLAESLRAELDEGL